jgi:L-alanine-DL-glutamate epimerase-like enolase superfamily enzyme
MSNSTNAPRIEKLELSTYRVPTDAPESDGTLEWNHTDLVVVHIEAGGRTGLGWSYASRGAALLIADVLRDVIVGHSFTGPRGCWPRLRAALRNVGLPGAGSMALAAVDVALWDLQAKLLETSLIGLFGALREAVPVYGSGGFTSYDETQLSDQLAGWARDGVSWVKMKVGRDPSADVARARLARQAVGDGPGLFVDANGAYDLKQSLALAVRFAEEARVTWFEEPRPSSDLPGLALLRARAPAAMEIAAGEYGDTLGYFRTMIGASAVDCLQADVTRCGGYTGFLEVASLCDAAQIPLSAHCAPELHVHVGCAVEALRHVEYFHDHVRIGRLLFDGVLELDHGMLRPDRARPGHGMTLKASDAERYRI